jgi:transcriptional regulator with XRE-family HTH domain
MAHRNRRTRWPEGTYMRLISGERLGRLIAKKGLSYSQFAEQVPCSKSMVGHLVTETRRSCTPELAERIARRLDTELDVLFVPSVSIDDGRINKQQKVAA